ALAAGRDRLLSAGRARQLRVRRRRGPGDPSAQLGARARPRGRAPEPRVGLSQLLRGRRPALSSQLAALIGTHLGDRRRSVFTSGLPLGLMSAFIVAIFPSVQDSLSQAIQGYPSGLKEAFGIGELSNVEQYLHAEMLSLIVPLAAGYLAVRAVAS